jgi:hypothetical protein
MRGLGKVVVLGSKLQKIGVADGYDRSKEVVGVDVEAEVEVAQNLLGCTNLNKENQNRHRRGAAKR